MRKHCQRLRQWKHDFSFSWSSLICMNVQWSFVWSFSRPLKVNRNVLKEILLGLGKQRVKVKLLSCVQLFATPWTVAYQAPLSMGFSRQECWSGLPFPSPGDLPNPGIEPGSPTLQADALPSEPPGKQRILTNKTNKCYSEYSMER